MFQSVSLADVLHMDRATEDSFECSSPEVPDENTVTKAWRLAREYVGLPQLRIVLEKRVPSQSGLGGGSSDAAGLLRGLVRVTNGRFSAGDAEDVAKAVGADVPFFLVGGRAKATGYGDILTPIPDSDPHPLVIVMPNASVSTAAAYNAIDSLSHEFLDFPNGEVWGHNDFESVAPAESKAAILELRSLGASFAGLSGSGAAAYGFFAGEQSASRAASMVRTGKSFVCRTVSRRESLWIS